MTHILIVAESRSGNGLPDVIRDAGFDVATAASLQEGLERSAATPTPILIITDRTLPDGSGLDLCREIRSRHPMYRMPVIVRTDGGRGADVLDGLVAGASGYMAKELLPEETIARVQQVLTTEQSASESTVLREEEEIQIRFMDRDYRLHASLQQLVNVLGSSLEDLARTSERLEAELVRRREAEQQLRDSEALYESLVESLPLNLLRKNLDGQLTFANQRYCQSLGRTREEMLGSTDYDLFPDELADKYTTDDRQIMETREVLETTESHVLPDGETRYVHVLKTPVYDAKSNVVGVQGIFWDVTARREAELALEHERFLLTSLLDSIPDNIFFKDREGRYLRVNRAMASRLGLNQPDDAVGKSAADFFRQEYLDEIAAAEARTVHEGISTVGSEQLVTWPDGSRNWVAVTRMPLREPNGNITGCFGVSHDITDQKMAQEAMAEARDAAESASEAKSNFLANMSHEIRTPMNAIIGLTELVLDTDLSQSQREYLTLVQESGESLLGVINDVLDFSKIEAGRLELDPRPFQLREVLGDTLKSLAIRAHRDRIEIACHIATDVPEFLIGDAGRLRQIIVNLVGNSIKFTEEGEIVVDVSIEEGDLPPRVDVPDEFSPPEPVLLRFEVTDTGIGIAANKLQRIFEAFEQADTSMTRRYEGTGLGLAISSHLIELMGGRIGVASELGTGSSFHFAARFDVGAPTVAVTDESRRTLEGRRILIVDDNATNRRILDEMLRNWMTIPTAASGAEQAISILQEVHGTTEEFDLILTDAHMPGTDGFALVAQLRERSDLKIPIVMMLTSSGRTSDITRCGELGIAAYLTKPVKQSELFDVIVETLNVTAAIDDEVSVSQPSMVHQRSLNVLLAEDSLVNQKLAVALLEKWGHQVTVAPNGAEAVRRWSTGSFDLILMDVQMPEMDGLEATRTIRQREFDAGGDSRMPIIAMTAHALKGDEERCLAAGMDAYVSKPIRAPILFQKLAELTKAIEGDGKNVPADVPSAHHSDAGSDCDTSLAPATGVVDWNAALDVMGGSHELLYEILESILEETPRQLALLRRAIKSADTQTARRAAHTVLGNMRAIGVSAAMDQATIVEGLAADAQFDALSQPLSKLQGIVDAVVLDIRHRLAQAAN
jgi:PAS domain S-box-containing protein